MERLFIPTLHTFAMNNIFTGSVEQLRFRIVPKIIMRTPKEVDFDQSTMEAEFWHGPYCYEKSEMEGSHVFPLTEQGRSDMHQWLASQI